MTSHHNISPLNEELPAVCENKDDIMLFAKITYRTLLRQPQFLKSKVGYRLIAVNDLFDIIIVKDRMVLSILKLGHLHGSFPVII